jgi:thiamine monophosphate synthase
VKAVAAQGAAGVAVISGIWDQADPVAAGRDYLEALSAAGLG